MAICRRSQTSVSAQVSFGSPESITSSTSWITVRSRACRSCSTSATRSWMPSESVCCQVAVGWISRFACSWTRSSSWTTSSVDCGASSTARSAWDCCSSWLATNSTSTAAVLAACSRVLATTSRARNATSSAKPDSAFSSGSLAARSRRNDDTAIIGRSRPGVGQVLAVELDDPPPVRVEVDLGHHDGGRRAPLDGGLQEGQLGRGQLLGGVGDEHDALGVAERAEGEEAVRGVQPADAGGVDQRQAGPQHPVRQTDLDHPVPFRVGRIGLLGDQQVDLAERALLLLDPGRRPRSGRRW